MPRYVLNPFYFVILYAEFQNFSSKINNTQVDVLKPLEDDIDKVNNDNTEFYSYVPSGHLLIVSIY